MGQVQLLFARSDHHTVLAGLAFLCNLTAPMADYGSSHLLHLSSLLIVNLVPGAEHRNFSLYHFASPLPLGTWVLLLFQCPLESG